LSNAYSIFCPSTNSMQLTMWDPAPWRIEILEILHWSRWRMHQLIRTLACITISSQTFHSGRTLSTSRSAASLMPMMLIQQLPLIPGSRIFPVVSVLLHCLNVKRQRMA
jgi:hypothetical protein